MNIKLDKYNPLMMYLSPASIPQIVAHIQDYLVKHPILSVETIAEIIVQSLQEHPELINGEAIPISAESQQSIKAYIDALPFLDTYTKAEINALLLGKQDTLTFDQAPTPGSSNPVTSSGIIAAMSALQSALETQISAKADRASTYTKTQVDTLLEDKADADDVYSKNTMDAKLLDVNTDIGNLEDKLIDQSQQITTLANTDTSLESGIAIIVNGDTATQVVPAGGYAYIKNNTHGLTEGLYKNKTSATFPASGGTANSTVFSAVPTGAVNDAVAVLNSNFTNIRSTPELKDQFFGAGNVAHGSVTCYKIGHIGILKINVNFSGSASLSGKIGSVPTGYRPVAPFTFNLTSPVATDNGGYFGLTTQGDVMCYISPSFTSSYYSINIPYFIK